MSLLIKNNLQLIIILYFELDLNYKRNKTIYNK